MSHQCNCGLPGEFKFPLTAQSFCAACFSTRFERKIVNSIPRSLRGHNTAIAFSGGKDSTILLHILHKYLHKLRIPVLAAIVLEEEIPEVQLSRKRIISKIKAKYYGVKFVQKSYTELFNYSLPNLIEQSDELKLGFTPCTICGILRRHGILRIALSIGADFIIMGNTLEDEAETILLNIIRGSPWKNYRDKIKYEPADKESLPFRIKPLSKVSERTIHQYLKINQIPVLNTHCPFAYRSLRSEISPFINSLAAKDLHVLYNIVSSTKKEQSNKREIEKVYKCKQCTSYSPDPECAACRIIRKIMKNFPRSESR